MKNFLIVMLLLLATKSVEAQVTATRHCVVAYSEQAFAPMQFPWQTGWQIHGNANLWVFDVLGHPRQTKSQTISINGNEDITAPGWRARKISFPGIKMWPGDWWFVTFEFWYSAPVHDATGRLFHVTIPTFWSNDLEYNQLQGLALVPRATVIESADP